MLLCWQCAVHYLHSYLPLLPYSVFEEFLSIGADAGFCSIRLFSWHKIAQLLNNYVFGHIDSVINWKKPTCLMFLYRFSTLRCIWRSDGDNFVEQYLPACHFLHSKNSFLFNAFYFLILTIFVSNCLWFSFLWGMSFTIQTGLYLLRR